MLSVPTLTNNSVKRCAFFTSPFSGLFGWQPETLVSGVNRLNPLPIYDPKHVEYPITGGRIQVMRDDGNLLPAYWSHPDGAGRFPAAALLHDWWGITPTERRLANLLAQGGLYVIIPDLFEGNTAATFEDAKRLVEGLGDTGYSCVNAALESVESHVRTSQVTAAIGLGMGASFAFEAAIKRESLEAAVAFYGFPQKFFGQYQEANTPLLALFGADDPFVDAKAIRLLERELANSPRATDHEVVVLDHAARDFFADPESAIANRAWAKAEAFLEKQLKVKT